MDPNFRIKRVVGGANPDIPAFWIESTAPENVDDTTRIVFTKAVVSTSEGAPATDVLGDGSARNRLTLADIDPPFDIKDVADELLRRERPELVVYVHGFNNPRRSVEQRFKAAYDSIATDPATRDHRGLVCVGYRWPSEPMFAPLGSMVSAMPGFLIGLLTLGALVLACACGWFLMERASGLGVLLTAGSGVLVLAMAGIALWAKGGGRALLTAIALLAIVCAAYWWGDLGPARELMQLSPPWLVAFVGLLLVNVSLVLCGLRLLVYFRDGYRAANYGVPDLVEVIRQIDYAVHEARKSRGDARPEEPRIKLSFVGHSMGALVVTGAVRILSDVFDPRAVANRAGDGSEPEPGSEIGDVFRLGRLVLVSPDIPAEALVSSRANFLASSLHRFEEAYLFSSAGDVVLRMLSTMANYFAFPTRRREHGFRLGNTEVLSMTPRTFGVVDLAKLVPFDGKPAETFLERLRVGRLTLSEISYPFSVRSGSAMAALGLAPEQEHLATRFTYFDCTNYRENHRPYLSTGNLMGRIRWWDCWDLLARYLWPWAGHVDVHSGYFDGPFTRQLIYRLACAGWEGMLAGVRAETEKEDAPTAFSELCAAMRIKALLALTHPAPVEKTPAEKTHA